MLTYSILEVDTLNFHEFVQRSSNVISQRKITQNIEYTYVYAVCFFESVTKLLHIFQYEFLSFRIYKNSFIFLKIFNKRIKIMENFKIMNNKFV